MKKLSIFTPTYNRSSTLPRLYDSLKKQNNKEFIWIIVDDGSSDNTYDIIQKWIREDLIEIKYLYQENVGKMRAHNTGVKSCHTDFFMCVDSDDYLTFDAVESIIASLEDVSVKHSGIVAYKIKEGSKNINNFFPDETYSTLAHIYKNGFIGETSLIYRTSILKDYLFPEIDGEKFITESYVYAQIDQKYELFILRKPLIIYSYQADGYTNNSLKLLKDNPKGWALYYCQNAKLSKSFKEKVYYTSQYLSYSLLGKSKKIIRSSAYPLISLLSMPLGVYLFLKRRRQFKKI